MQMDQKHGLMCEQALRYAMQAMLDLGTMEDNSVEEFALLLTGNIQHLETMVQRARGINKT